MLFDPRDYPLHIDILHKIHPITKKMLQDATSKDKHRRRRYLERLPNSGALAQKHMSVAVEYAMHGKRTYAIGPNMRLGMLSANLSAVPAKLIRLPVPCIYVSLPACVQCVCMPDSGENVPLIGFYVYANHHTAGHDFTFFVVMYNGTYFWQSLATISLALVPCQKGIYDFEEYLASRAARGSNNIFAFDFDRARRATSTDEFTLNTVNTTQYIVRLLVSLLMYTNATNAEIRVLDAAKDTPAVRKPPKGKKSRSRRPPRKSDRPSILWLGSSAEKAPPKRAPEDRKRLKVAYYRRAHFHTYWTGRRIDDDGNPIPRSKQKRIIKWTDGVWVHPAEDDTALSDSPTVLRCFPADR